MNIIGAARDLTIGTLSSLVAALIIYAFGALAIRKHAKPHSPWRFALSTAQLVDFPSAQETVKFHLPLSVVLLTSGLAFVGALGDVMFPSVSVLQDPGGLIFQAQNVITQAQQNATNELNQGRQQALQLVQQAEEQERQSSERGGKKQLESKHLTDEAASQALEVRKWHEDLAKHILEEGEKQAAFLRSQAADLQAERNRYGPVRTNYAASFMNSIFWGVIVTGFLASVLRSLHLPPATASGYLASFVYVSSFGLVATFHSESIATRSFETVLVAAALYVSGKGTLSVGDTVVNTFVAIHRYFVTALKTVVIMTVIGGIAIFVLDGLSEISSTILSGIISTMSLQLPDIDSVSKEIPVLFGHGQLIQALQLIDMHVADLVSSATGFITALCCAFAGVVFLSSLSPKGAPSVNIPQMSFLETVYRSLFSAAPYRNPGQKWAGGRYLLILVLLAAIVQLIGVQWHLSRFLDEDLLTWGKRVAPLSVSDGKLSVGGEPGLYALRDKSDGTTWLVLDTGNEDDFPHAGGMYLIVGDEVVACRIYGYVFLITDDLSRFEGVNITYEDIVGVGQTVKHWLVFVVFPLWITGKAIYWLVLCLLLALVIFPFIRSTSPAHDLDIRFRIVTIAVTPIIILHTIIGVMGLESYYADMALLTMTLAYVGFAVYCAQSMPSTLVIADPMSSAGELPGIQ